MRLLFTTLTCLISLSVYGQIQFGIYDVEQEFSSEWSPCNINVLSEYWDDFVSDYMDGGLNVLAPFTSGNCCVMLDIETFLEISETNYGYQFPANSSNQIMCNQNDG